MVQLDNLVDSATDIFPHQAPAGAGSEFLRFQRGIALFRPLGEQKLEKGPNPEDEEEICTTTSEEDDDDQISLRLFTTLVKVRGRDRKDLGDAVYTYLRLAISTRVLTMAHKRLSHKLRIKHNRSHKGERLVDAPL
ncbi:hypothetical protein OQA88_11846 [Cercophora sp. LCS_1]